MKGKNENLICAGHFMEAQKLMEIKTDLDGEGELSKLGSIFKAMGDQNRLKIIYVLSKSQLCVCDIATLLNMTQSSISHHLKVLRDLNLVKFEKRGKLVVYSLDDDHVVKLMEAGLEHVKHID